MMRSFKFQALLALAFLLLSSTFFSNPILELKDRVLLNNNTTIFGADVVKNSNFEIPEILYRLVIAYIPSNVNYMELSAQVVANLIRQNLKGYEVRINSDKIIIQRRKEEVEKDFASLKDVIENFKKTIEEKYGKGVEVIWPPFDSTSPNENNVKYSYSYTNAGNGYFNILMKEISNGKVLKIRNFKVHLVLQRMVVVAKRKINYGEIIQEGDLELKKVNVFGKTSTFVSDIKKVVGKRAKRNFNKDDPIVLEYLETPPYVTRGQVISAYVSIDGITVTTFVRLMEDGNIGEVVSARNIDTGQLIYGVVEKGPRLRILVGEKKEE